MTASLSSSTCPQCGKALAGSLCSGLCPQCMAASMLGEWGELAEIDTPPDELIITRVADYDVLRVIGRGGMGVVCRARDRLLGREVALKLMHSGVLASDEELRRFRTEAEAVARLRHPNLVTIFEAGEADGQAFYIMSLAEGGTLAQRLADEGPMPARAAAELVEVLAQAVHHAHARGVLHRDLKPANIIFDSSGTAMVSDFGLARFTGEASVTDSGSLIGTPAYLAPEVASGTAGHTISSDVYALGVILYECITGHTPFENDSPLALLKIISEQDPPELSTYVKGIDSDLEAVCMKALSKTPEHRYSSAEALSQDLRHWLNDEPVSARAPLMWERFYRWSQRNQSRAILYTMAAVSLLILVVASAVMNVLLTAEQTRLADAMHRSDTRRAVLLRDFASRLLKSSDGVSEARAYLLEAAGAGTGNLREDRSIALRVRIIDRLFDTEPKPLPLWKGEDVENAWFDKGGKLFFKTSGGVFELDHQALATPAEGVEPPSTVAAGSKPSATMDGERIRVWTDESHRGELDAKIYFSQPVAFLSVSDDGECVAALTPDDTLYLWESYTGLPLSAPIKLPIKPTKLAWDIVMHQIAAWDGHQVVWLDW